MAAGSYISGGDAQLTLTERQDQDSAGHARPWQQHRRLAGHIVPEPCQLHGSAHHRRS
jgi:hypothetical protein